jgi:anti-anti-sigma factor
MEIEVAYEQGRVPVTVLRLRGPLVSEDELQSRAQQEYAAGARNFLIDLSGVPYMATAGLRALHSIYTMVRTESGAGTSQSAGTRTSPHLKLLQPSRHVAEALQVAGYTMFIEVLQDRQAAINSFGG